MIVLLAVLVAFVIATAVVMRRLDPIAGLVALVALVVVFVVVSERVTLR